MQLIKGSILNEDRISRTARNDEVFHGRPGSVSCQGHGEDPVRPVAGLEGFRDEATVSGVVLPAGDATYVWLVLLNTRAHTQ